MNKEDILIEIELLQNEYDEIIPYGNNLELLKNASKRKYLDYLSEKYFE